MSIEAMWYASYDKDGRPPKCNRLIRMTRHEQLGMAFDLALDFPAGRAGYRIVGEIQSTGENYWWWPRDDAKYGDWWLLPKRTIRLMERATKYAEARAQRSTYRVDYDLELSYSDFIRVELRRLQRRARRAGRQLLGHMIYRAALQIVFLLALTDFPALVRAGLRAPWDDGSPAEFEKWPQKIAWPKDPWRKYVRLPTRGAPA